MKPLVFLDFDGVLNYRDWLYDVVHQRSDSDDEHRKLHPEMVARVNRIVKEAGAEVVISSTWRMGFSLAELNGFLRTVGFEKDAMATTPYRSFHPTRGAEIQAWLDAHGGAGQEAPGFGWGAPFVILDDDSDMGHLRPRLVKTTFAKGIQEKHVKRALRLLSVG